MNANTACKPHTTHVHVQELHYIHTRMHINIHIIIYLSIYLSIYIDIIYGIIIEFIYAIQLTEIHSQYIFQRLKQLQ